MKKSTKFTEEQVSLITISRLFFFYKSAIKRTNAISYKLSLLDVIEQRYLYKLNAAKFGMR